MDVTITAEAIGPFAVPARPAWIRAMIPEGVAGAYQLLKGSSPFYIGRSDTCLAGRLCGHELLGEATHVTWEVCLDPVSAYHCEAYWFDRSRDNLGLRNRVHPARPTGYDRECPFCAIDVENVCRILGRDPGKKNRPG